jgi:gliding motility-associated-like protein
VLSGDRGYFYKFQYPWQFMKCKGAIIILGLFLLSHGLFAQISPDCLNAIPICNNTPVNAGTQGFGQDDFAGSLMSGCLEQTTSGAIESNSAWYRFRTGASGELGFNIGFDTSEDWDFALYRTNDCGNLGDPVRCNFFDNSDGEAYMGVGVDPTGSATTVLYEPWLQVSAGEDYYLLINNFSNTNSGFSIQFTGQIFVTNPNDALDCSIISNLLGPPIAACENENITLDATTPGAIGYQWFQDTGNGFQPIAMAVSATFPVPASALYRVEVITPSTTIYSDVQVAFTTAPTVQPIADRTLCYDTGMFDLSQLDSEALGMQDPGSYNVSYHGTPGDAALGINPLQKNHPLIPGTEALYVRITSMANAKCFDASGLLRLITIPTPLPDFPTEVTVCENSGPVFIGDSTPEPQYTYNWDNGENTAGITVDQSGVYTLTATTAGGGIGCSVSWPVTVVISKTPAISEIVINDLQASNTVEILADPDSLFEYRLDNGPFQPGNLFSNVPPGMHTVTVNDPGGCGMVTETISVVGFPRFFSPNGDGNNDLWYISGLDQLPDPVVYVYDRYGKLLKQMQQGSPGWDGRFNGREMPAADYWFKLTYTNPEGQRVEAKYIQNHFSLNR